MTDAPPIRGAVPGRSGRRFLMAGGGTGGHVIPAIAVAQELQKRGHSVFFVGTERGLESRLVPAAGFELRRIEIGGLNRVSFARKMLTLWRLPLVTAGTMRFADEIDALFSMGGYVAGPPVIAALLRRRPVVVMEPNAIPGFTNRRIARFVARALVNFPETVRYFPRGRTEVTGMPVRAEFFEVMPRPRGETLNLLVTGGSQGSRTLNRALQQSWPLFRNRGLRVRIVHQTGTQDFEATRDAFAQSGIEGEVVTFIRDMPAAFAQADIVICRSGAGTVSELAAAGRPSILVPFPFAADDHQTRNAEAMAEAGAARMLRDAEMTGDRLVRLIEELSGSLDRMGEAARKVARPGAAVRAADILEEVATARL
ncbi:MAG TPA: undecaprenyldiphospho-muramoylpentapeptide beta-N-acetylglucosaminyltransferase [Candidatus Acidoferrum sp.]|jgi:UDP-N-acetylglucosamine--N-acetylmuramyl-(pentapeptide) pyrophosphoryl-undecaprenol N-acetylglucosamine transferase|nr:undecaprenyldiphospho-muramoylpentapeptide beta-N-acetylglucosaminyltransferase [Candidatus Acidoferrum sp.]